MADLDRIKRNVAKMAAQNAPVEDIDGYISSEGTTVDAVRSYKPTAQPAPETGNGSVVDTLDAFGRGAAKGASLGFIDEIGAGARWLGGKMLPWQPEVTYDQALDEVRADDKRVAAASPIADVAGQVTGAVGLGGGLVRAGLSPTAAVASRGGGLLAATGASAVEGGTLGAIQGFGQGEGTEDRLGQAAVNGAAGLVIGAALPSVISGATNAVRRVVTPNTTSAARQGLVGALEREGVDVTAGQATGNNTLRYAEGEIGGQAAADMYERQGEQFTRAALQRAGINADRATPEVIDQAFTRIGQQFDDLGNRNTLVADRQLQDDLVGTWRDYMSTVNPSQRAPVVGEVMNDLNNVFRNNGSLDGTAYQSMRSRLERVARGTADPDLSQALRGMRASLDDAMERSIAQSNPNDLGAFRDVRNQYRNMITLEQAATGAGENAAAGIISPAALRNATVSKQGRRNYARGNGDFAELARAGEGVMKPMPQSGTAPRTAIRNLGAAVPAVLGAGAGGAAGGGLGAVAGMAAGAAIPQVVGRMMMTPAGQAYLRNQLLSGSLNPQTRAGIVAAINQIDANFIPSLIEGQPSQVPNAAAR